MSSHGVPETAAWCGFAASPIAAMKRSGLELRLHKTSGDAMSPSRGNVRNSSARPLDVGARRSPLLRTTPARLPAQSCPPPTTPIRLSTPTSVISMLPKLRGDLSVAGRVGWAGAVVVEHVCATVVVQQVGAQNASMRQTRSMLRYRHPRHRSQHERHGHADHHHKPRPGASAAHGSTWRQHLVISGSPPAMLEESSEQRICSKAS